MKLKQLIALIGCAVILILFITAFRAVWGTFTRSMYCASKDLSVSSSLQGATGSLAGQVSFTNISDSACYLTNPEFSLSLSDSSGTPLNVKSAVFLPAETLITPKNDVSFTIVWSNWCGMEIAQPVNLVVNIPSSSPEIISPLKNIGYLVASGPRCDDPQSVSTLTVRTQN